MRILWVKAGKILPVNTGGRIRSFNILRHLAERHETTFLSYYGGDKDIPYENELAAVFPGAVCIADGTPSGGIAQLVDYATRFAHAAPYAVSRYTTNVVRDRIQAIVRDQRPDVIVCDFLAASLNFPSVLPAVSVLFQHNVEHALWDRIAQHQANPAKKLAFSIEAAKMRRYERATVGRFHHVVAVSENDRALMAEMTDPSRISIVRTGVDVAAYRGRAESAEANRVMFLGSMDWPPNVDGVEYFCKEIWPRVLAVQPEATFHVIGRLPSAGIQRLASSSIEIVGGVETVVPHLHAAAVFVVPLRMGGGTRLKIYEAMAAERAIVSTTVGAEGLDVEHDRDIVIADRPQEFADAIVRLLRDDERRLAIGRSAGQTAALFDWSAIAREFESVLEQAANQTTERSRQVSTAT